VISERNLSTRPHPAFEESVFWLDDQDLDDFFANRFKTPAFYDSARRRLERFCDVDPIEAYADLLAFAAGFGRAHQDRRPQQPWRPERIHLGSGKDYKSGWLNIDILDRAQPDLLLDLARPLQLPLRTQTACAGPLELDEGQAEVIVANNVLEHVSDLPQVMGNCLQLLKTGGRMLIEVPYEHAPTAWQDPTHLRALNENSWLYYTDWFWYLGWFEHRFAVEQSVYLNLELQECARDQAAFMRVALVKVDTTLRERMTARTMSPELELPEDVVDSSWLFRPAVAQALPSAAMA
jgi:SAM-dependent methyltransferase